MAVSIASPPIPTPGILRAFQILFSKGGKCSSWRKQFAYEKWPTQAISLLRSRFLRSPQKNWAEQLHNNKVRKT